MTYTMRRWTPRANTVVRPHSTGTVPTPERTWQRPDSAVGYVPTAQENLAAFVRDYVDPLSVYELAEELRFVRALVAAWSARPQSPRHFDRLITYQGMLERRAAELDVTSVTVY